MVAGNILASATQGETLPRREGEGRRFCLLGASFSTGNLGVNALAASTIVSIARAFPRARIYLLDYAKQPSKLSVRHTDGAVRVELLNIRFSWKVFLSNNIALLLVLAMVARLMPAQSWRLWFLRRNSCLRQLLEIDTAGSLAGGDSFSDIYGLRRLVYVALPQVLVILLGKPLVLLPQTLGPFDRTIARMLAGWILRRATWVVSRDHESLQEVQELMQHSPVRVGVSYDMAFALESYPPGEKSVLRSVRKDRGLTVGINVNGLVASGGYSRSNMFGIKDDYPALMKRLVRFFVEEHGARVVLFPHVFAPDADPESDPAACRALVKDLGEACAGRVQVVQDRLDQSEMKHLLGECDFFLGSRMHACIGAISKGVPTIGLAYSKKFVGVFRTIGAEDKVVDLRTADNDEVMRKVKEIFDHRLAIRDSLEARMPVVKGEIALLIRQVTNWDLVPTA